MAASWALSLGTTELTGLLGQVLEAHDVERCALTHQLQENTGQALATLAVQLRLLERHCTDAEQSRRIGESRAVVAQALHDLESLLLALYPPALEGQGLGPALEVFVQEYVQLAQVHVELDLEVFPERLPSNVEVGLFRIAQDALQAVCRRPMVGRVRLLLRRQNAMVTLTILDDGPGPLSVDEPTDWGLARACWRAESLGGGCSMKVCPDCGSRFEVSVPLELEAVHHD